MIHVDLSPMHKFRYVQNNNHDFNFVLLDETYRALHTPFQCKDYIQDIFWSEYTGKFAEIYGISWEPCMLDTNTEYFNLALMGGDEILRPRVSLLETFLHQFEDAQEIPHSRICETNEDKIIVVQFHKDWTKSPPLLSAFTSLIRLSGMYSGGDALDYLKELEDIRLNDKYLAKFKGPEYVKVDILRLPQTLNKFAALLQGKKVELGWSDLSNTIYVHNTGIIGYKDFPTVEV